MYVLIWYLQFKGMGIYLFNALSLPIYYALLKNKKKLFIIFVSMQMFLILALRADNLGVDLPAYKVFYRYIANYESIKFLLPKLRLWSRPEIPYAFEAGYVLLNYFVAKLGIDFHGFLVICAFINMVSVGKLYIRYADNPCLTFMMFIALNPYIYCFGILRQSLAMSVLLWAVPAILKKRWKNASLIIFIAFLFHRSAIVFLMLIPLSMIRITRKIFGRLIILSVAVILIVPFIIRYILTPVMLYAGKNVAARVTSFRFTNLFLILILVALCIYLFIDFSYLQDEKNRIMCWGFILVLFCQPFSAYLDVYTRFQTYFIMFVTVLIPNLIKSYNNKNTRLILNVSGYALLVLYMYFIIKNGQAMYPYRFA